MINRSHLHLSIGAVSLLLISFVLAIPAEANIFTCRASALRINALGLIVEPVVANPADSPCAADAKSLLALSSVLGVSAGVLNAKTTGSQFTGPVTAEGSAANVKLVSVLGLVNATAAAVDAKARVDCVSGVSVLSSQSSVANANVLGKPITLLTTHLDIPVLGILGLKVATLHLNETIGGPHPTFGSPNLNLVTQRALWLQVTNPLLSGLTDVVAGEATADIAFGNPCASK